ncbi:hypothetical protein ATL41_1022 [Flavimobilis soli]|uniref:Lipoprotein n=1 Tax=Flavimobilis soli TaxID=442709 RepID=A0A2A9EBP1_9MICO|nr:hypothetical protein [Flavimobilis soli]PFG36304.1 hypothetical protein ATL41_1022 [Flavimobilis soli]
MRHAISTRTERGHRAVRAAAVAGAVALVLAGCTEDEPIAEHDGMSVLFDIAGRGDKHPDGKGPLHLEDPARIAETAEAAGHKLRWVTRYRFPVEVEDAHGKTWQLDGYIGDETLVDVELYDDEPTALATGFSGPVTLLVPDLAHGGEPTEVSYDVVETENNYLADEEDARGDSEDATLHLNEAAFTELVETAGGVAWDDAAHATGAGGPAEPKVVSLQGEFPPPRDGDAQRALWEKLKAAGYFLPFLS